MAARLLFSLLLAGLGAPPAFAQAERTDEIGAREEHGAVRLEWADAEDKLTGTLTPARPLSGSTVDVALRVGSYYGTPFSGPLILAVRPQGALHANATTVLPKDGVWRGHFEVGDPGPYQLDVQFRTTHPKALHAAFAVQPEPLPRGVKEGALALCLLAAAIGVAVYARGRRKTAQPLP